MGRDVKWDHWRESQKDLEQQDGRFPRMSFYHGEGLFCKHTMTVKTISEGSRDDADLTIM